MKISVDEAIHGLLNARLDEDTSAFWDFILAQPLDEISLTETESVTTDLFPTPTELLPMGVSIQPEDGQKPLQMPNLDIGEHLAPPAWSTSPPPLVPIQPTRKVPKVGTWIQQSGNTGERKLLELALQTPPPLYQEKQKKRRIQPVTWAGTTGARTTPEAQSRPVAQTKPRITAIEPPPRKVVLRTLSTTIAAPSRHQ